MDKIVVIYADSNMSPVILVMSTLACAIIIIPAVGAALLSPSFFAQQEGDLIR